MERASGTVVLQAILQKDGTVGEHCVLYEQPIGYGFDDALLGALKQARYKPATQHGEPIETVVTVGVTYSVR